MSWYGATEQLAVPVGSVAVNVAVPVVATWFDAMTARASTVPVPI